MRIATLMCVFLVFCSGCTGRSDQTLQAYNALGRGQHLDLVTDGYIIGIEKYARKDMAHPPEPGYPDRLHEKINPGNDALIEEENSEFRGATHDRKAMAVTQIASYFPDRKYVYNAYAGNLEGDIDYEGGCSGLKALQIDLQDRLRGAIRQGRPFTHIFIMSMGWNNDQYVSISRYNKILTNLAEVADEKGNAAFRPLVVGLTWPSAWFSIEDNWLKKKVIGHLGSYTNKSNDADEIGYSIANWLINVHLRGVRDELGLGDFPKVIAVGHSMGARLLSRAVFSKDYLSIPPAPGPDVVDIFIGLQGAFSARRFVAADSGEGAPYRDHAALSTRIVLTSSENDRANPFAFWSKHAGGGNGLKYMKSRPDIFAVFVWRQDREKAAAALDDHGREKKIVTLDVREIVTGNDAHNDILDADIAELIWHCLRSVS